jgi:uncharacterized caspase-like protein
VLTGSLDNTARLWDVAIGKELQRLEGHSSVVWAVAFAPDGRTVLTGSLDNTARLWDAATGKELQRFEGHSKGVTAVAFAPDGRTALTGSEDHTARLWDLATSKELQRFEGHSSTVWSVAFAPDGRTMLTGSSDKTARLWDMASGRELCRLISFHDGSWAVADPDGRFDASNGGDVEGLHWVVANEPIDLAQLKERYYEPGLLAKIMGFNKEPVREVSAFTAPRLYPEVILTEPNADSPALGISLTNRGGGIGRVVVKINGKELTADARSRGSDSNAANLALQVNLRNDARLIAGQPNVIEVQAFNAEGYLRSRGLELTYEPVGRSDAIKPEVWAVVAGVSDYRGDAIDLRYAAKDADDFATGLAVASRRLFGAERVHLSQLTTPQARLEENPGERTQPTRTELVKSLQAARKAKPTDILVIYLAGHGVNYGGQDGDFYFLTSDASSADLSDPQIRVQVALSSQELTELVKQIPALKQVLILDTCASGRLVEKLTEKRDVPSSQIRALERVKDRTGLHVLAGCAADAVSYETSRYGQGLLTYSLLLGMRGAKLREDEYVDVADLFGFAADHVPELANDIGGIQRPIISSPKGASFLIGRVTAQDQAAIPLQTVKPLILRTEFQEEEDFTDLLGLGKRVDELLRSVAARGHNASLVFVDAREFIDAYQLAGRYRIEGDKLTVTARLARGGEKGTRFTVEGNKAMLDDLAAKVASEAEKRLADAK